MSNRTRDGTVIYLTDTQVAILKGAPALQTLRNHRSKGTGIKYRKAKDGRISYLVDDVVEYIKNNNKHNKGE